MKYLARLCLPGFLLQSVVIGGGYATGRELVEFFLSLGPVDALLGMIVATALFSVIAMLCFEFARISQSYNYRDFFRHLLGRYWPVYEVAYFVLAILVIAVLGAASGEMVAAHLQVPGVFGTVALLCGIAYLVFRGSSLIEPALAYWSLVLYLTFGLFVTLYLYRFGGEVTSALSSDQAGSGWFTGGLVYVGYNIVAMPAILFCVHHIPGRRDALLAGLLAGPLTMLPAFLLMLAMLAAYPSVIDATVPTDFMMRQLDIGWLKVLFLVVIFGTFIETGTAYIHAVNERLASNYRDAGRSMPGWLRPLIAIVALGGAVFMAEVFGIIRLISQGYATLTWVFIGVFIVPLCTIGLCRISRRDKVATWSTLQSFQQSPQQD